MKKIKIFLQNNLNLSIIFYRKKMSIYNFLQENQKYFYRKIGKNQEFSTGKLAKIKNSNQDFFFKNSLSFLVPFSHWISVMIRALTKDFIEDILCQTPKLWAESLEGNWMDSKGLLWLLFALTNLYNDFPLCVSPILFRAAFSRLTQEESNFTPRKSIKCCLC